jgi:Spy/CpxP family protein refolding chaperone
MLAILAAGVLAAGVAVAQHPGAQGGAQPEGMHGFGRLHKELNLNPQQEQLWQRAQALQRDAFKTLRAKGEENRAKLRAEIDKPGVDLKQFAESRDQQREQLRAEMDAARKQVRSAWFSVYDSLDPQQREQVRVAIRDGMDRMGHRGMRHGPHGGAQGESLGRAPFDYSAGEG